MRVVANAGLNLPPSVIARYGIHLIPERIVVDGIQHDTRHATFSAIDAWFNTARETPYVLATSAAELVADFDQIGKLESEIAIITTSRKLVGTCDAALAAKRVLSAMPRKTPLHIEVIDTMTLDIGAAMLVLAYLEGARQGRSLTELRHATPVMTHALTTMLFPADIVRFAKGSQAAESEAMLASANGATPLIQVIEGEPKVIGRVQHGTDPVVAMADALVERVGVGRKVWVGLTHDGDPRQVHALLALLAKRLDVAYSLIREESAALYLNLGMKSFGAGVLPVDCATWNLDGQPVI